MALMLILVKHKTSLPVEIALVIFPFSDMRTEDIH